MEEGGVCNTSDYAEVEPDQAKFRNAPGYMRNIFVPVDKKRNRPCYCIFVILLQTIGNYVISDAINMITLVTIRKHYDT